MNEKFLTFEEEFNYFSDKYELQYIRNAIEIWLDFQVIQKDIFLFVKSPNVHPDGPSVRTNSSSDRLLDTILEFDLQRTRYLEINTAFTKLNHLEQIEFYKIYFKRENTSFFKKYDLLVKLAKFTDNYIFSEGIESYYLALKEDYMSRLRKHMQERKKNIERWSSLYNCLIHPDWKGNWHEGNGEASRHRTMFVLATLYKDGLVSERYLFELIEKYRGGKKYYKYVVRN